MKIRYDQDMDALTITFKQNAPVDESDETRPGVILDYDSLGELVSIEILNASEHIADLSTVDYQRTPQRSA
ncbi:MAG: DUF2283 domain-containing protein [Spirochaeta sp.]|jgi:uncharacterized protein YuzE|nr:DUF2283 domain-containing protein [Spirochaeta sp.]